MSDAEPIVARTDADHPHLEVGAFGPWATNAYLVWDGRSPDALVLDPGMGAAEALVARVAANGLKLHLIADSHGHIDHIFDNGPLFSKNEAILFGGDVLFAGSIGRTDLPGGDDAAMVASLARLARELPPGVRVLPGHGAETTLARELPWMRRIAEAGRLLIPG